jgi:hypothetical protein
MNIWVRQQISALREHFYNASHWVRQRIPVLREHFYNASHIDQLCLITALLFTLSLPIYLFVPTSLMGKIFAGIFSALRHMDSRSSVAQSISRPQAVDC